MNLKELSKILGLSQTTVSRALNGFPEVNAETRKRVADAARLHNYTPNSRAKGLATGRAFAIGHIIPISTRNEILNPIFADFIAGAGEVYSSRSYDMVLSIVDDCDEDQAYRDLTRKQSVDGVIVHAPRTDDPRIEFLQALELPFVVHGRGANAPVNYNWVDVNNRSAFLRATEFLLDLGHERIALLNGREGFHFAARRRMGFEQALESRNIEPDPKLMRSGDMVESLGYDGTMDMMRLGSPPSAFLVSSMLIAIGVRRAVQDLGLQLGSDVSLITHDDDLSYLPNSGDIPMFTATKSSVREAGRRCAGMLLDVIDEKRTDAQHDLWEAQLVVGKSTGPVAS